MTNMGKITPGATVNMPFNTYGANGESVTVTDLAVGDVRIYKDGGTTQRASSAGVTLSLDFDGDTGGHMVHIDTSDDTDVGFYADGSSYEVRFVGTTIAAQTVSPFAGIFLIDATVANVSINYIPTIPPSVDLADTAPWRVGLRVINSKGALPTSGEMTAGTYSVHWKNPAATSWSAFAVDQACSKGTGYIYFNLIPADSTFAEGDSIRFIFKDQKVTLGGVDYVISDSVGIYEYSSVRQTSGGGGLTAQQTRDSMKLAFTGGAPASDSIDEKLDTIPTTAMRGTDIGDLNNITAASVWAVGARALTDKANFSLSTAGIKAIWDQLTSALSTAGSVGKLIVDNLNATISSVKALLPAALVGGRMDSNISAVNNSNAAAVRLALSTGTIVVGTAVGGTLSQTEMTTDLTEVTNDHYIGRVIIWIDGNLKDQATDITDYNGVTKKLTFTAVTDLPVIGNNFIIV